MLITVTVLHETLRIEVTGHALGPVHSLFTSKPAAKDEEGQQVGAGSGRPRKVKLPLVDADEVVRLAARAPLHLVPAAAGLPGRHAGPARAVRPAARLGGQAVAAPLHGRRRAARRPPRCCASCTRRRSRSWRRTAWTPRSSATAPSFLSGVGPGPDARGRPTSTTRRPPAVGRFGSVGCASPRAAPSPRSARRASSSNAGRAIGDAGQASASIFRVSPSSCGSTFVWPTTGMKLVSPPQRGHDVLVQVRGDARARHRALVHPDVEAVRPGRRRAAPSSPAWSARPVRRSPESVRSV